MTFLKLWLLERPYRHVQRYRHILSILFKYGFADLVDSLGVENYFDSGLKAISFTRKDKLEKYSRAELLRMALEELGPTFIKLGQFLSTRSDLLPKEFIFELEKLQDNVLPFDFAQVKEIIETELESPLESKFKEFEEKPVASASLGQVHRARLMGGETVAVKVQRPDIQKTVETDMEILLHLASLGERHIEYLANFSLTRIVNEMTYSLEKELDYKVEAAHIHHFASLLGTDPDVYIPKVHLEYSTDKLLTMEYIFGQKASAPESWTMSREDKIKLADRLAGLIMKQIFEYGFFHADLHPGNIFFLPENIICFLDFGMMGRLNRKTREDFADLIISIADRDETAAADALLRLTYSRPEDEDPNYITLQRDVADFMGQHCYRPLKEVDLGTLLQDLLGMISTHQLRIVPSLYTMLRSLVSVEGLCKTLDPDFDTVQKAEPYVARVHMERFHPRRISKEVLNSAMEFFHLLKDLPTEMREIFSEVKRGKLKVEFKHMNLEPLVFMYDRSSKRLAFSIVLAALIVGSALIILSGVPPILFGVPLFGLLGFLFAGFMGFWLLISILRKGGM